MSGTQSYNLRHSKGLIAVHDCLTYLAYTITTSARRRALAQRSFSQDFVTQDCPSYLKLCAGPGLTQQNGQAGLMDRAVAYQGVVVFNLLHGRLCRQGELDGLEVV